MSLGAGRIWLIAGTLAAAPLVFDPGTYNLQLSSPTPDYGPTTLSVGSVGMGSQAGASYVREGEDDPFHSIIPSERSFRDGGGLLLHVPLGNITVR